MRPLVVVPVGHQPHDLEVTNRWVVIPDTIGFDILHHESRSQRPTVVEVYSQCGTSTTSGRIIEVLFCNLVVIDGDVCCNVIQWACRVESGSNITTAKGMRSRNVIDKATLHLVVANKTQCHSVI